MIERCLAFGVLYRTRSRSCLLIAAFFVASCDGGVSVSVEPLTVRVELSQPPSVTGTTATLAGTAAALGAVAGGVATAMAPDGTVLASGATAADARSFPTRKPRPLDYPQRHGFGSRYQRQRPLERPGD